MAVKKKKPPAKEKKKKVRVASSKKKGRVQTKKTVKKTAKVLVKKKAKKPAKKTRKTTKKIIKKTKKTVKKTTKKKMGRRKTSAEIMATKLEPYLKAGLSMRKACLQAGVVRMTVQRMMKRDEAFVAKINSFQDYKSVMASEIAMAMLQGIHNSISIDNKGNKTLFMVSKNDIRTFIGLTKVDRSLREEFGDRLTDEDAENSVQFDQPKTEREADLQARVLNKHHDYINKGKSVDDED